MDEKVKQYLASIQALQRFYWSPRHPRDYVVPTADGRRAGIGLIAHEDFGAFNVVWATLPLQTLFHHRVAHLHFIDQKDLNQQVLDGMALGDWLTLLSPDDFRKWYTSRRGDISPPAVERIDAAVRELERLPPIRQRHSLL